MNGWLLPRLWRKTWKAGAVNPTGNNQYTGGKCQNSDTFQKTIRTDDEAADKSGLGSRDTLIKAEAVVEKAEPEVVAAMDNQHLSIHAAHRLSQRKPEDQKAIATKMQSDPRATTMKKAEQLVKEDRLTACQDLWTDSQKERQRLVQQGVTVVASQRANEQNQPVDAALLVWAKENGLLVSVDRSSIWGNPFELPGDGDRTLVCKLYADQYLPYKASLHKRKQELMGKVLACWCHPQQCHGDELAKWVNNDGY